MSHDATFILDALGRIPRGVTLTLSVHTDSYPTPVAVLQRRTDCGSHMETVEATGNGADESLEVALAQAINEAVDRLERERDAIAQEKSRG